MSEIVVIALILGFFAIPLLLLYVAVENETSNPTVVNRSEAEQIARDRGGRPEAREDSRERETDDSGEWGSTDEWGASREDRR